MKKLIPMLVIATLLLSGCGIITSPPGEPTPSDEVLATRVAQILTAMPTNTAPPTLQPTQPVIEAPAEPTATETVAPTEVPPTATATKKPTVAQATETPAPPTPTAPPTSTVPATDPRLRQGSPAFTDGMDDSANWPAGVDPAGFTSVVFENGQMVLTGLKTTSGWRLSTYGANLQDFYIEMRVRARECTKDDRYGIYFRVPEKSRPEQGYWFGLTCDGRYALQKWDAKDGPEGKVTNLIFWTANAAINAGPNATNRMGVMTIGRRIILYVNGVQVGESSDNTWLSGAFGVFVGARETKNFTIEVDQIDVWTSPKP